MIKIKQREVMKTLTIAQLVIKQTANVVNIPPGFTDSCVSMNEFALAAITSIPAKVFRADKPKVDERRLRRSRRQVEHVQKLICAQQALDSERIKAGCDTSVISDSNGKVIGVSTGHRCNPVTFNEQYLTHLNSENSEESYLIELHEKAGFNLPYNIYSLQSLRASYNFKANKAGIETYKWTNK